MADIAHKMLTELMCGIVIGIGRVDCLTTEQTYSTVAKRFRLMASEQTNIYSLPTFQSFSSIKQGLSFKFPVFRTGNPRPFVTAFVNSNYTGTRKRMILASEFDFGIRYNLTSYFFIFPKTEYCPGFYPYYPKIKPRTNS